LAWPEEYEMEQFFVVNSNAKSVSTTIAYDILTSMGQAIPGLMQDLDETGRAWQVHGHELAKEMAEFTSVWMHRIRFANQSLKMTTVLSAGFVNSLKPILASPYFGRLTLGAQAKVLAAYWEAIKSILPGAFSDPQGYVIQKSLGVQVAHSINWNCMRVLRISENFWRTGNQELASFSTL
jgi:hypothetical protein